MVAAVSVGRRRPSFVSCPLKSARLWSSVAFGGSRLPLQCVTRNVNAARFISKRNILSATVKNRMETMVRRHAEVMERLQGGGDSSTAGLDGTSRETLSTGEIADLGRELSRLAPLVHLQQEWKELIAERESIQDLLDEATVEQAADYQEKDGGAKTNSGDERSATEGDADFSEECEQELQDIDRRLLELEERLMEAVLPRDEQDVEDAVLEIRAGTGGDEASLFCGELLEAYKKAAKALGWQVEVLHSSQTDYGGTKDAAVSIVGGRYSQDDYQPGPYGFFKYESGVHRVQRVPFNDTRIHTSACSVGVLPAPADTDGRSGAFLPMSELRIDTFRASGAGGQHVNTTESAVRITHIPTGITASIQDERSQHKNKAKALKLVSARVREALREQEAKERGEAKQSLMGGGNRSERIRTYNYPQDRVTDHRCKQSEFGIIQMLQEGSLVACFAPALKAMHREELFQEMEEEESRKEK